MQPVIVAEIHVERCIDVDGLGLFGQVVEIGVVKSARLLEGPQRAQGSTLWVNIALGQSAGAIIEILNRRIASGVGDFKVRVACSYGH